MQERMQENACRSACKRMHAGAHARECMQERIQENACSHACASGGKHAISDEISFLGRVELASPTP